VVSFFLGREQRQAYRALYCFARGADYRADDLAGDVLGKEQIQRRTEALLQWKKWINDLYTGKTPTHPAFTALQPVVERYEIDRDGFERMVDAFVQDQTINEYKSWEHVREYTVGSAEPVGRWVLRVHEINDPQMDKLSDEVCAGLQLVNFIQDIRFDLSQRGRIYLPMEELKQHDVSPEQFLITPTPMPVRNLIRRQCNRAEKLLQNGNELAAETSGSLRRQLHLFVGGGRLALEAVRSANYDVNRDHIKVGRGKKLGLLAKALSGRRL
jgi:squalene synthase HpnC